MAGADRLRRPVHLSPFTRENMARRMASCLDWILAPRSERPTLAIPHAGWDVAELANENTKNMPTPTPVGRIDPLHV